MILHDYTPDREQSMSPVCKNKTKKLETLKIKLTLKYPVFLQHLMIVLETVQLHTPQIHAHASVLILKVWCL